MQRPKTSLGPPSTTRQRLPCPRSDVGVPSTLLPPVAAARCQARRRNTQSRHVVKALATEQGFAYWLVRGTVLHGWALAMQGHCEGGLAEIRHGLATYLDLGTNLWQPYFLGLLAEAFGVGGYSEEGLNALAEALAVMDTTEARFYGAELYRLKGALLLRQAVPDVSQAEACFHQAIDIARHQQAKSWELRTATSLARLWQSQDKRREAYDLLAPVYECFTEGFDTADPKEAGMLLDELAKSACLG